MKQTRFQVALVIALGMILSLFAISCEKEEFVPEDSIATEGFITLDDSELHVCIDKYITTGKQSPEKAAVIASKLWNVGQTVRIRFLGGDAYLQGKVMQNAKLWEEFANIKFQQVASGTAEIRIAFEKGGSWSYFGKDANYLDQNTATMNFGWFDSKTSDQEFSRTTLHEFGHALGMIHEHQHPVAGIPWDTAKVYEYYTAAPNNWTREDVNHNLFERYNTAQTQFCKYDPASIMHYSVPEAHTIGNFQVSNNTVLSDEDKSFLGKLYPFTGTRTIPNCNNIWYTSTNGINNWQSVKVGNAMLAELAFGDFNGDKKTDAFRTNATTGKWEISWSTTGEWQVFQSFTIPVSELAFGDFNADGKTDIFRNNGKWEVWTIGANAWKALNTNNITVKDLRFADFNADGKTDVFYVNPSTRKWQISWSGTSTFQNLNNNTTYPTLPELAFGDFNGDKKADVLRVTVATGKFEISWSGTSTWQLLFTQATPAITALAFKDFDGDGKTDIFRTNAGVWQVAYSGNTAWQNIRTSLQTISQLAFGDFNGDGKADVLNIR